MTWIHQLSTDLDETADVLGSKAFGLVTLLRLGLPVPPGFVIRTEACREFLQKGQFPDGLDTELTKAVAELNAASMSVRSGSKVSMPGMMNTVLNVSDPEHLRSAIIEVFQSWNTPRAKTYRALNDIPDDLGTAVTVQQMVYGDRDDHSGTGVAFSRNPNTGEPIPYGDVLFGHQGDAVVSGARPTSPLAELASEPAVWNELLDGLQTIEQHYRDACYVEFTYESGRLWFLQVRPGRFTGRAAIRLAVELAEEGAITRADAVRRVSRHDIANSSTPRIVATDVLARGIGASPGVAVGKVVTTSDEAVRAQGPVILVRPETSPLDMHGLAASVGVVTSRGGPASHAAVVARSMRKPAVVGVADLSVDDAAMNVNGQRIPAGTLITIDGTSGEVVIGQAGITTAADDRYLTRYLEWMNA